MNFQNMCRLCLIDNNDVINIESQITTDENQETIANILNNCLNFQVQTPDEYPQNVCEYCVKQIKLIFSFKSIIENSKKILERYQANRLSLPSPNLHSASLCKETQKIDSTVPKQENTETSVQPHSSSEDDISQLVKSYSTSEFGTYSSNTAESLQGNYLYCSVCDARFLKGGDLLEHCTQLHRPAMSVGEACNYCQERYPDFKSLASHTKKHFTPFICPWCWAGFVSSSLYDAHLETCEKYEKPKTELSADRCMRQCQHCGKSYPRDYLSVHIKIHGEGQYKCQLCSKAFKQPTALYMHTRHVHSQNKPHACGSCGKAFKCASSRQAHVRKVHNNERRHACGSCGKTFFAEHGLKKHLLTHTGARSHKCQLCHKTYQARSGLSVHIKSHHL